MNENKIETEYNIQNLFFTQNCAHILHNRVCFGLIVVTQT
jgi:hypothetical protein